ncbi:MAG TPA: response regulator, partial [Polyangia bacterium]
MPRRYLIVDDNVAFAENLAEIIADAGDAEAVVVDSGPRALELVKSQRFDALVSDMRMPIMNGAELVHRIRSADPELPAVVVTAYTADNELEAARQEGVLGVLPKPVPVPRLLDLLSSARRNGIVALVEDDVELADNLSEALRMHGFASVTAHSVIETERLG